ncbi:MAG TPA: hypothetical protein VMW35_04200 [Myxococcota bacterium]|jgi:hypothetical protein|nr:hypothetical protein [Myxococcota bacterium]
MSGDRGDRDDRPKLSWRERDARRNRSSHVPRDDRERTGPARSKAATEQYIRQLDQLFTKTPGGAEADRLGKAIRDAHGTPGLAGACEAYRSALGFPSDASLLALFLDAGEAELVCGALERLASLRAEGRLQATPGLRTQLRLLTQDPDDGVAEGAEDLLAQL